MEAEDSDIELMAPMRGSKDGYVQTFFQLFRQLGMLICNSNSNSPNISLLVDLGIASITDDADRQKAYDLKDERIEKALLKYCLENYDSENLSEIDSSTRKQITNEVSIRIMGDVMAWYDGEIGITHKNVIGSIE